MRASNSQVNNMETQTSVFTDEQVKAERFMEELDNGAKLCRLVGVLQSKIPQDSETQVGEEHVKPAGSAALMTAGLFGCNSRLCFVNSFPQRKSTSRKTPPLDRFSLGTTPQIFCPGVVI